MIAFGGISFLGYGLVGKRRLQISLLLRLPLHVGKFQLKQLLALRSILLGGLLSGLGGSFLLSVRQSLLVAVAGIEDSFCLGEQACDVG